jgi:hypothetical protein
MGRSIYLQGRIRANVGMDTRAVKSLSALLAGAPIGPLVGYGRSAEG